MGNGEKKNIISKCVNLDIVTDFVVIFSLLFELNVQIFWHFLNDRRKNIIV